MLREKSSGMRKGIRERKVKVAGMGRVLGGRKICFGSQTRYRLSDGETLLDLAERAAEKALYQAGMGIGDMECIVCAMATPLQAIPCNGVLVHERLAKGLSIPAIDINTTCTSFISAVDIFSCLVDIGKYDRVLILSGDTASAALNPDQKESFELFSDGAAACVLEKSSGEGGSAVIYTRQETWSQGAHDTEIRGGGGLMPVFSFCQENRDNYYFDMKGSKVLKLCARGLPGFVRSCMEDGGISLKDVSVVVPHQASRALGVIMPRLGFPKELYLDRVSEYGNLVSASVPFVMCEAVEQGRIKRGDLVILIGTAAGLTVNFMLLRY